jgi:membrane protein required for colicin V production
MPCVRAMPDHVPFDPVAPWGEDRRRSRKFAAMNWLDWFLAAALAIAAVKGFIRGFIIEVCALLGFVAGVWLAVLFSDRVGEALGLGADRTAIAFVVTLVGVVLLVHLLGKGLTKAVDIAQLGLPNKLAGGLFGALRSAFMLSVLLNLLAGWSDGTMPSRDAREGSGLHDPLRAMAPLVLPALGRTEWVGDAARRLREEVDGLLNDQ